MTKTLSQRRTRRNNQKNQIMRPLVRRKPQVQPIVRKSNMKQRMTQYVGPSASQRLPEQSIGSKVGSFIGHGIENIVRTISGLGDYTIKSNSLLMGGMDPPEIMNSYQRGAVVVRHREFILDVPSSTDFAITTLPINPGVVTSFPWLAQVAANYEEYIIRGMVYEFKSTSSDAVLSSGATQSLGTVIMATQYDAYNPQFPDKITMENYEYANSSKPSMSFFHPIECQPKQSPISELYVRTSLFNTSLPNSADRRLYDFGIFNIATQGQQATAGILGELWCTYEMEFYKPKNTGSQGYELLTDHYQLSGVVGTSVLGTASTLVNGSNIGTVIQNTGSQLAFPFELTTGSYLVELVWYGSSVTVAIPAITVVNGSLLKCWFNDSLTTASNNGGVGNTAFLSFVVKPKATAGVSGQTLINFGVGGLPSSSTGGDLFITQINGLITT